MNIHESYDFFVKKALLNFYQVYHIDKQQHSEKIFYITEECRYDFRMGLFSPELNLEEWFGENLQNIIYLLSSAINIIIDEKVDGIVHEAVVGFSESIQKKPKCSKLVCSNLVCSPSIFYFLFLFLIFIILNF